MFKKRFLVKTIIVCNIQGKKKIKATATASIFGINASVISLIEVAA